MIGNRVRVPSYSVPLTRNRDYLLLTAGESVSVLGSTLASTALPLAVYALTNSFAVAGVIGASGAIGSLLSLPIAGVIADRYERRRLMQLGSLIRLVTWTIVALLVLRQEAPPVFLGAVLVTNAFAAALFRAGESGMLKTLIEPEQFPTALTVLEARANIAGLAGGPLAGFLMAVSVALPFAVNAVTFAASFIGVSLMSIRQSRPSQTTSFTESLGDGVRFLWGLRAFRWILPCQAITSFAMASYIFTLILLLRQKGVDYWVIGLYETAMSVGLLIGSAAVPFIVRRVKVGTLAILSMVVMATSMSLSPILLDHTPLLLLVFGLAFILAPASNAATGSYLAIVTPLEMQGRVSTAEDFSSSFLTPLSFLQGGALLTFVGTGPALLSLAAITVLGAAMMASASSVRRLPIASRAQSG